MRTTIPLLVGFATSVRDWMTSAQLGAGQYRQLALKLSTPKHRQLPH